MIINFSIKNIMMLALTALAVYIGYLSHSIIIIAIFGILLAHMVNPVVEKICRFKIPRVFATIIVFLLVILLAVLGVLWLGPEIYRDIQLLTDNMPVYIDFLGNGLEAVGERIGMDLSKNAIYAHMLSWMKSSGTILVGWLGGIAGSLKRIVELTINIVMVPVIAFMLLVDGVRVMAFINKYIGIQTLRRKYLILISNVMASYFRGQLMVALVLAVLYTVALKIAGLEVAVLMGVLTGLLSIVPFLGFTIGIVLSVMMAAIQFQDLIHPLYVIIGYAVVQALESTVITPKIVGESVGIHPVVTIVALLVGGSVAGLTGMIFAVPVTAVAFQLYKLNFSQNIDDFPSEKDDFPPSGIILDDEEKESLKNIMNTNGS